MGDTDPNTSFRSTSRPRLCRPHSVHCQRSQPIMQHRKNSWCCSIKRLSSALTFPRRWSLSAKTLNHSIGEERGLNTRLLRFMCSLRGLQWSNKMKSFERKYSYGSRLPATPSCIFQSRVIWNCWISSYTILWESLLLVLVFIASTSIWRSVCLFKLFLCLLTVSVSHSHIRDLCKSL